MSSKIESQQASLLPINVSPSYPTSKAPWKFSQIIAERMKQAPLFPGLRFKHCEILPQDPEYNFILEHFTAHKPVNQKIVKIMAVEQETQTQAFEASLEKITNSTVTTESQAPPITILSLWYGTSLEECPLICDSGFTCLDKEEVKKGLSLTNQAQKAFDQSQGVLLFYWVSIDSSNTFKQDGVHNFQHAQILPQFWLELEVETLPKDIEGYYCKCLVRAKESNSPKTQIFYLKKLSTLFIQKGDLVKGSLLLNSALAILLKNHGDEKSIKSTFQELELIEKSFFEKKEVQPNHFKMGRSASFREQLHSIREEALQLGNTYTGDLTQKTQTILKKMTQGFKQLLRHLIDDAQQLLGPPPAQSWACIGLGSMARNEMSPYSDIEFAFLIKKVTSETLDYFRILSKLLEIKIINLGETPFPVFGDRYPSPNAKGFCMDSGGNTPLGKPGVYELIATPKQLIEYLKPEWWERDIILSNVLSNVCYVAGNRELVHLYNKEKQTLMNKKSKLFDIAQGKKLALLLLQGNLKEYKPDISAEKEKQKAFGIKQELYRPFQSTLSALALFYDLKSRNVFKVIDELLAKQLLSAEGAANLKEVLSLIFTLRLHAHFFYRTEQEYLVHLEHGATKDPSLLYIDQWHINTLFKIYRALVPFHKTAEQFCIKQAKKVWKREIFHEESSFVRGQTYNKTFRYQEAKAAYQEAINLDPQNTELLYELAAQEQVVGNAQRSIEHLKQALTLNIANNQSPKNRSRYHNLLGISLGQIDQYTQAIPHFQTALSLDLTIYGENSDQVANSKSSLALSYTHMGNWKEAQELAQSALAIFEKNKNEEGIESVAQTLAMVAIESNDPISSIGYNKKAVSASKKAHGKPNPHLSKLYSTLAIALERMKQFEKAIRACQKGLSIAEHFYGKQHFEYCVHLHNLGDIYSKTGQTDLCVEHLKTSVEIMKKLEIGPVTLAQVMSNLGSTVGVLQKKIDEGLDYCQQAMVLLKKSQMETCKTSALVWNTQGEILITAGKYQPAIQAFQKALSIAKQYEHPDSLLLRTILEHLNKAQKTQQKIDDILDNPQELLIALVKDGKRHMDNQQPSKASDCFEKALSLFIRIHGSEHPKVRHARVMEWGSRIKDPNDETEVLCRALTLSEILSGFEELKSLLN